MLAWGIDATDWDSSVDMAFIASDPDFNPPDERFIRTTWHDNQSIAEVLWFACNCTNFDAHDFHDYVMIMVGENPDVESELMTAIQDLLKE